MSFDEPAYRKFVTMLAARAGLADGQPRTVMTRTTDQDNARVCHCYGQPTSSSTAGCSCFPTIRSWGSPPTSSATPPFRTLGRYGTPCSWSLWATALAALLVLTAPGVYRASVGYPGLLLVVSARGWLFVLRRCGVLSCRPTLTGPVSSVPNP